MLIYLNQFFIMVGKRDNQRPIFHYEEINEIKAGGILFYRYNEITNENDFLLINSRNNYEDFGGRTDQVDSNIIDTISREVYEESNCIFEKDFIIKKIENNDEKIYIPYCKYLLYIVKLDDFYEIKDFGDTEIHDNIKRTCEWIPQSKFMENAFIKKLNFRLKYFKVLNHIKTLII